VAETPTKKPRNWQSPGQQEDEKWQQTLSKMFKVGGEKPGASGGRSGPLSSEAEDAARAEANVTRATSAGRAAQTPQETLKRSAPLAVGALVLVVGVVILLRALFGGGEQPAKQGEPAHEVNPAGRSALPAPGEARETGVIFEAPVEKDGDYYLKVGEISWKGKLEEAEGGQVLTLEGTTAAQFRTIEVPDGKITTGIFGRAEPGKPILYANFLRTNTSGEEITQGTYQVTNAGEVLVSGDYRDQRSGDTVTRVYVEDDNPQTDPGVDRTYSVKFVAPPEVPIPALVGWEQPEVAQG
jgi:hypothetical protein